MMKLVCAPINFQKIQLANLPIQIKRDIFVVINYLKRKQHLKCDIIMKTTIAEVNEDGSIITIIAQDGEVIKLRPFLPIKNEEKYYIEECFAYSFQKNYSQDRGDMVYRVLCDMFSVCNFTYDLSEKEIERKRIGQKIKEIRQQKNYEAKYVAKMAGIDAANLCRIEQGKYSVGLDVLYRIAEVLGLRIDLVENEK